MAIAKKIGGAELVTKINQADAQFLSMTYVGKAAVPENWTHTASLQDFYFECDPREQHVNIELPVNASSQGAVYVFKMILPGETVIITAAAGDYIDNTGPAFDAGAPGKVTLTVDGECVMLIGGPGRWRSIAHMASNP